jgi:hypothetical protein
MVMVLVWRGRRREDAKRGVKSTGEFDGAQVGVAHPPAEF